MTQHTGYCHITKQPESLCPCVLHFKSAKQHFLELVEGEWHKNADHWGVAMHLAFDVAGVAYERGLANVLQFRPGAGGVEPVEDEWRAQYLAAMDDGQLAALQSFLKRVLDALERAGKSY